VVIANVMSERWQARIASVIAGEEQQLEKTHLIAQNIGNFQFDLDALPPHISLVNYHYALPAAVQENLDLGGVIGLDETGFMPGEDSLYLDQAWRILLSGAGLYNNLDYSFTTGSPSGEWDIAESNPGWGGPTFRKKLGYLARALEEVPYVEMDFHGSLFKTPAGVAQYALYKEGSVAICFIEGLEERKVESLFPKGNYELTHMDVDSGERQVERQELTEGAALALPFSGSRAALIIRKQ
jgi:hypothetical protein